MGVFVVVMPIGSSIHGSIIENFANLDGNIIVYVHVHTRTYTYIHVHTRTYTYTYTYIHVQICYSEYRILPKGLKQGNRTVGKTTPERPYIYIYLHIYIYMFTYITHSCSSCPFRGERFSRSWRPREVCKDATTLIATMCRSYATIVALFLPPYHIVTYLVLSCAIST